MSMSKQLKPFERIWTDEEEIVLKANYLKYTQRELHEKFLPDKTPVQICQKKMDMKLFKPVWTNKERGLLIDHGADYTHKELVAKFFPNKSPSQVHGMRKYLGIKRHQKVE